jgi:hypothetical protein
MMWRRRRRIGSHLTGSAPTRLTATGSRLNVDEFFTGPVRLRLCSPRWWSWPVLLLSSYVCSDCPNVTRPVLTMCVGCPLVAANEARIASGTVA